MSNDNSLTETEATVLRALLAKLANTVSNKHESKISEVMNLSRRTAQEQVGRGTFRRTVFLVEVLSKRSVSDFSLRDLAEGADDGLSVNTTEVVNQKVPKYVMESLLQGQGSDPSFTDAMD